MNMTKKELRQKYRALRDSFGEEFIERASIDACKNLAQCKAFIDADTVLLYYPINNEISTVPLLELCFKIGKTVAFPVCQKESSTLLFKRVSSIEELSPSSFGILEPNDSCKAITQTKNTVCIFPALLFSRSGHRLGYGKGFYDRFLRDFEGVSIGLSYSALICDDLPQNEHDIPLDLIVNESEVLKIVQKN